MRRQIARECVACRVANVRQQQPVLQHAAAEHDAFHRRHECDGRSELTEIAADDAVGHVLLGQGREIGLPATLDGNAARDALETVAVKRADAREREVARVATHEDVAHLGMHTAAQCLAVDRNAGADTGPDSDVRDAAAALAGTELGLGKGGCVHVGVELDGAVGDGLQRGDQVRVRPAGFRRREHASPVRRAAIQLNRPERSDAEAADPAVLELHRVEELEDFGEGFGGLAGGDAAFLDNLVDAVPDGAEELAPACFDRPVETLAGRHAAQSNAMPRLHIYGARRPLRTSAGCPIAGRGRTSR